MDSTSLENNVIEEKVEPVLEEEKVEPVLEEEKVEPVLEEEENNNFITLEIKETNNKDFEIPNKVIQNSKQKMKLKMKMF